MPTALRDLLPPTPRGAGERPETRTSAHLVPSGGVLPTLDQGPHADPPFLSCRARSAGRSVDVGVESQAWPETLLQFLLADTELR